MLRAIRIHRLNKDINTLAKMGRKEKELDLEKLATVCQYPMTNEDIASIFDLSVDTVSRIIRREFGITFADYKYQKQSTMRFALLAKQLEVAKSGNVSMLIWLGKQYLHQTEKIDQVVNVVPTATRITFTDEREKLVLGAEIVDRKKHMPYKTEKDKFDVDLDCKTNSENTNAETKDDSRKD